MYVWFLVYTVQFQLRSCKYTVPSRPGRNARFGRSSWTGLTDAATRRRGLRVRCIRVTRSQHLQCPSLFPIVHNSPLSRPPRRRRSSHLVDPLRQIGPLR
uniref:Uncharacterized protein n=1 Tax=Arundo donax TaxID=35708 RepID=A0A0A9D266_ARUDO